MRFDYERAAAISEGLEDRLARALRGEDVDRRTVLGGMALAGGAAAGLAGAARGDPQHAGGEFDSHHGKFGAQGEYDDGFDPHEFLRTFNTGFDGQASVEQDVFHEGGDRIRYFEFTATDSSVEIAPGVDFPVWAYEGQVPGPTIRATEGDLIRIKFVNGSEHAHTIHPHLRNLNPAMDGIPQNGPGVIERGDDAFTYEWRAQPAGVHLYHCHSLPLKEHIHRGLYGTIVIDPDPDRVRSQPADYCGFHRSQITPELRRDLVRRAELRNHEYDADEYDEMVMVMNGFDTNFDGDNEVYAANTRAFAYAVGRTNGKGQWQPGETKRPITIDRTERQRVYLVNTIEFDLINSFHTHSQFFDYYDHGTTLLPTHETIDTVMQCQAQRGIIELDYGDHQPGLYMFHAHQSEFAELGWMSFFEVV